MFVTGVTWFALSSVLNAIAPTSGFLIGARALQGVGAALLTPGSLAILEAVLRPGDRGKAIGAWSGSSGVGTAAGAAAGPFIGGWLVAAVSWRLILVINLPIAGVVVAVAARHNFDSSFGSLTSTRGCRWPAKQWAQWVRTSCVWPGVPSAGNVGSWTCPCMA